MKRAFFLTIVWFIGLTALAHGELPGPLLGHVTDKDSGPEYLLNFNFGIEQWENGERHEEMNEQWLVKCHFPSIFTKKPTTYCSLDRTKFWLLKDDALATSLKYESIEETLKLIHADWESGVLDFSIVHKDKTTTEVKIRMIIEEKSIYLSSFQAYTIARGVFSDSLAPIEFRIPQYTYTLNVPIKMRGLRSEEEKKMDDLLSSLSQQDQKAWTDFKVEGAKKCDLFPYRKTHTEEQMIKEIIPGWEEGRELTVGELDLIKEYVIRDFSKCLGSSNISLDGQKNILETMRDTLKK